MTITGVDDNLIDGSISSTVTVTVDDANSDNDFDAVADQTVTHNNNRRRHGRIYIVETDGSTEVAESGTTDTFTVVLDAQPLS